MTSGVGLPLVGGRTITLRAKHMPWALAAHLWAPFSWRSCLVTAWLPTRKRFSAVLGTLHMLLGDSSSKLSIEITESLCVLLSVGQTSKTLVQKMKAKNDMWSLPVFKSLQCVAANILDTRSMAAVKVHYSCWKLFLAEESHSGQTTCYASYTLVPSKLHRQTQGWTCHLSVAHELHFGWSTR